MLLGLDVPVDACLVAGPYSVVGGAVTSVTITVGILLGHAVLAGLGARLVTLTHSAVRSVTGIAAATGRVPAAPLPA